MRIPTAFRKVCARLARESGYTLIELIIVMVIMSAVMTPLVGSFTTGMAHEVDQSRREQAYANARLALQRMRVDVHCAGGVTSVDQNAYGGFTLTLTENYEGQAGWCPTVIPAGDTSTGVQWCTVPKSGSSTRFVLYRFLGLDPTDCGTATSSTFQIDYIAVPPTGWPTNTLNTTTTPTSWIGNLWPDSTGCTAGDGSGKLPTTAVDINVAVDPVSHPKENYQLEDEIALRNANRC